MRWASFALRLCGDTPHASPPHSGDTHRRTQAQAPPPDLPPPYGPLLPLAHPRPYDPFALTNVPRYARLTNNQVPDEVLECTHIRKDGWNCDCDDWTISRVFRGMHGVDDSQDTSIRRAMCHTGRGNGCYRDDVDPKKRYEMTKSEKM